MSSEHTKELRNFYKNNKLFCKMCRKKVKMNQIGHLNWTYDYNKNGLEVIYCSPDCRNIELSNP